VESTKRRRRHRRWHRIFFEPNSVGIEHYLISFLPANQEFRGQTTLAEPLYRTQEVGGSNPPSSTPFPYESMTFVLPPFAFGCKPGDPSALDVGNPWVRTTAIGFLMPIRSFVDFQSIAPNRPESRHLVPRHLCSSSFDALSGAAGTPAGKQGLERQRSTVRRLQQDGAE
jgi:hypothetical protein